MSWTLESQTPKPKVIISLSGIQKKVIETNDPEEVKSKIIGVAREAGLARFDVFINGRLATPDKFNDVFKEEAKKGEDIVIDVVRIDKSGSNTQ